MSDLVARSTLAAVFLGIAAYTAATKYSQPSDTPQPTESIPQFIRTALNPDRLSSVPRTRPARATLPRRVAVSFLVLNDVSNQPRSSELPARMRWLDTALRERLSSRCGYRVVPMDSSSALYANPELAADLASAAGAEWAIVPRLNRASPWVTDLQANVVRVGDTSLVSNRIVEIKGVELSEELAAQLAERGAAWMADQLSQAIEHAAGQPGRLCPP